MSVWTLPSGLRLPCSRGSAQRGPDWPDCSAQWSAACRQSRPGRQPWLLKKKEEKKGGRGRGKENWKERKGRQASGSAVCRGPSHSTRTARTVPLVCTWIRLALQSKEQKQDKIVERFPSQRFLQLAACHAPGYSNQPCSHRSCTRALGLLQAGSSCLACLAGRCQATRHACVH